MTVARNGGIGGGGERPVAELSYTEASRELDDIVAFFEGREVDVDQLVGRLARATAIVDELDHRLRRTRTQVEELVPRLAAAGGAGRPDGTPDEPSPPVAEAPQDVVLDEAEEQAELEEAELEEADELVEELDEVLGAGERRRDGPDAAGAAPGEPARPPDPPGLF